MGFLLILPILVSGFVYCHNHPAYFLKLHRYEGQYLYLLAAKLGIFSLLIAIVVNGLIVTLIQLPYTYLHWVIGPTYIDIIANALKDGFKIDETKSIQLAWLSAYSFTMLIVPFFMPKIYFRYMKWRLAKSQPGKVFENQHILMKLRLDSLNDSPLDKLLFDSMVKEFTIMISLDDRKVYVGRVSSTGEPNETEGADQEIVLIPMISGHRDKDTLEVELNIPYETVKSDSAVVIPQERIISASRFDFDTFRKFKELTVSKRKDENQFIEKLKKLLS